MTCGYTKFIPGPDFKRLPQCMQNAIKASQAGKQTIEHDRLMGSICEPNLGAKCNGKDIMPYCMQDGYKNTSYCSCVNNTTPWVECLDNQCRSLSGYRSTTQRDVLKYKKCPSSVTFCQNVQGISGESNRADNLQQNLACNANTSFSLQNLSFQARKTYNNVTNFIDDFQFSSLSQSQQFIFVIIIIVIVAIVLFGAIMTMKSTFTSIINFS